MIHKSRKLCRDDLLVADRSLHEARRSREPAHPRDRLFGNHRIVVWQIALDHVRNQRRLVGGNSARPTLVANETSALSAR